MMSGDLISHLRDQATSYVSIKELPPEAVTRLIGDVAKRYVLDTTATWWWTALKEEARLIAYGEDEDGLEKLREIMAAGVNAFLVVTDDEPPPWIAFSGLTNEILDLISDVEFFEFFIVEADYRRVLFDTHDNCLIIAGEPKSLTTDG